MLRGEGLLLADIWHTNVLLDYYKAWRWPVSSIKVICTKLERVNAQLALWSGIFGDLGTESNEYRTLTY